MALSLFYLVRHVFVLFFQVIHIFLIQWTVWVLNKAGFFRNAYLVMVVIVEGFWIHTGRDSAQVQVNSRLHSNCISFGEKFFLVKS